ncbi:MAG: hypothetical protein M0008_01720 [Actinomycetota bacterium]|nr:hypothetical protein [Actinomycetota bacterium]
MMWKMVAIADRNGVTRDRGRHQSMVCSVFVPVQSAGEEGGRSCRERGASREQRRTLVRLKGLVLEFLRPRTFAIVAAGVFLSSGAYALTASASMPASALGAGSVAISGYDVGQVSYTFSTDPGSYESASASNPMIASVTFTLTKNSSGVPATTANTRGVDAVVTSTSSGVQPVNYSTCSAPSHSDVWRCSLDGTKAMSALDATGFSVTASGS